MACVPCTTWKLKQKLYFYFHRYDEKFIALTQPWFHPSLKYFRKLQNAQSHQPFFAIRYVWITLAGSTGFLKNIFGSRSVLETLWEWYQDPAIGPKKEFEFLSWVVLSTSKPFLKKISSFNYESNELEIKWISFFLKNAPRLCKKSFWLDCISFTSRIFIRSFSSYQKTMQYLNVCVVTVQAVLYVRT